MLDGEWQLSYANTALSFGTAAHAVFNITAPDLGDYDIRASDTESPRGDGINFGSDFFGSRTIAFDLGVRPNSARSTRTEVSLFAAAWRADAIRSDPGAVAQLASQYRNLERVVFGRPRRVSPILAEATRNAQANIVADFVCADNLWYDAAETSQSVALVPATGTGGFVFPLVFPLAMVGTTDRSTGITVGGEVPTWPIVEIRGPITDPVAHIIGGPRFTFRGTLAQDDVLVIDTRPWARTVLLNGLNAAGRVTRNSTRLASASVAPGGYEVSFFGTSVTATASLTLRWRNAWTTP